MWNYHLNLHHESSKIFVFSYNNIRILQSDLCTIFFKKLAVIFELVHQCREGGHNVSGGDTKPGGSDKPTDQKIVAALKTQFSFGPG